ncbi:MAG: AAA family ATPase [Anaerolineae bacterium]
MAVLTVSRQLGSRGSEIAAGVAERLSLRFVDREIIHRAASEAGVPQATLTELSYEGQRSLIERVLNIVNTMPVIPQIPHISRRETTVPVALPLSNMLTPAAPIFSQPMGSYVQVIEQIIRDLADQGNVVIVGRGGRIILRDRDDALHTQIVAPFDRRVETLIEREKINRSEARVRVIASDRARSEYMKRYYNIQWTDPSLYDLVINTGKIDTLTAIELIVRAQMVLKK